MLCVLLGAGLAIAAIAGLSTRALAGPVSTRIDCLLVTHASIKLERGATADPSERFLRMANNGHEITAGKSRIVVVRLFEDDHRAVDSEVWTKITLELAPYPAELGSAEQIDVRHSYYSWGGVGFSRARAVS
jgi:hypothetical protein